MSKPKTQPESQIKPNPSTMMEKPSDKNAVPVRTARSPVASALSLSNGTPPAGSELTSMENCCGAPMRARMAMSVQRSLGNNQVLRRMGTSVQAKLKVSSPNDAYEQEADQVADHVMRMAISPESEHSNRPLEDKQGERSTQANEPSVRTTIMRTAVNGSKEKLYRELEEDSKDEFQPQEEQDASGQAPEVTPELENSITSNKGTGHPLPESARDFFEPRFNRNFSHVRVHSDSASANMNKELGSRAFATGSDIFLEPGGDNPKDSESQRTLAHELTHVIQQANENTTSQPLQLLQAKGVTSRERRNITSKYNWYINQLTQLELKGEITSEDAEERIDIYKNRIEEVTDLAGKRETNRKEARRIWMLGRQHLRWAKNVEKERDHLIERARLYRGTSRHLTLISNMSIVPRTIRVHEGETARISFILKKKAKSIDWKILEAEGSGEVGGRMGIQQFHTKTNDPGYKNAYWNGIFAPGGKLPPETRTYRVRLTVIDESGKREEVWDQIRVENPENRVVHPRHDSGYALKSIVFNGKQVILSDDHGNQIVARAVSGLMPKNKDNPKHIDYTQPGYQWEPNKGPIPEGNYTVDSSQVQQPEMQGGQLSYGTGRSETAQIWGIGRIALKPNSRTSPEGVIRSGFFIHIDVNNDGTAGGIGIHPDDAGKFNSFISLMKRMPGTVTVSVRY
jgi:hypothetical protein